MKRFIDTDLWDKDWFMELSQKHKLFFQFLFSKCDCAGVWTPNYALASLYVGEAIIKSDLDSFKKQIDFLNDGKIFIKDFVTFQYGVLTEKCMPHRKIISTLKKHGLYERVLKGYQKTINTLEEKEEEEDKEEEKEEYTTIAQDFKNQKDESFLNGSPIQGFENLPTLKEKVLKDQHFIEPCFQLGIMPDKLPLWLDNFHKWLMFTGEKLKQENEYRRHFRNWITKIPNYSAINPEEYQMSPPKVIKPQSPQLKSPAQLIAERSKST